MTDIVRYSSCYDTGLSYNSVTLDYWNINKPGTREATLTSSAITLCFILIGVPSNLLILVSILRQRLYREPTYILLLNLAVADLLMCLLYMPFTVVSGFAGEFLLGPTDVFRCRACQFIGLFGLYFGLVTVHILSLLSLDRFLYIKYPLKYHSIVNRRRTCVASIGSWVFCVIPVLPPLFDFGEYNFGHSFSACSVTFVGKRNNLLYAVLLALEMIFPLTLLIGSNVWILHIIRVHMVKMNENSQGSGKTFNNVGENHHQRNHKSYKHLQLFKAFGAIFVSNIVTWVPFFVHIIVSLAIGMKNIVLLNMLVFISITSFAVIHPIIQATLIPELKKYIVGWVKRVVCWQHVKEKFSNTCCWSSDSCFRRECSSSKCSLSCLERLDAVLISRTTNVT